MDAIKKKMMSLAAETAQAEARAKQFEDEANAASSLADKTEDQVCNNWLVLMCVAFDSCFDYLFRLGIFRRSFRPWRASMIPALRTSSM